MEEMYNSMQGEKKNSLREKGFKQILYSSLIERKNKLFYFINWFSSSSFTSSVPDFGVQESIYTNKFLA